MSTWPRVPGYRPRWQLYLDYPWRLEAGNRVYTPQGVEQVTDITGLPGIIICKALWASFSKKKRYIRTAYYYYYYCWGTQCYMYFLCNTVMGLENSRMAMASIIEYEIKFCLHVCLSRVSFGDREHQCTHVTCCQDLSCRGQCFYYTIPTCMFNPSHMKDQPITKGHQRSCKFWLWKVFPPETFPFMTCFTCSRS